MKIKNLVKLFVLNLSIISLLSLIGCSGTSNKEEDKKNESETTEEKEVKSNGSLESSGTVKLITGNEFRKYIYDYNESQTWKFIGSKPCIIDFYADWCGPCKMIAPHMEDLAKTYSGKVDFYKVNVDNENELANAFNVQSIPAILFCPGDGSEPQFSVGAMEKSDYEKLINDFLKVK